VATEAELIRISHLDFNGISGEFGFGADKLKTASLANRAAPAVASDEPASTKSLGPSVKGHVFVRLVHVVDAKPTSDRDPRRVRPSGQDGFEGELSGVV
jgi:hypothetical protein